MFNDSVNISNHLTELREREREKKQYTQCIQREYTEYLTFEYRGRELTIEEQVISHRVQMM